MIQNLNNLIIFIRMLYIPITIIYNLYKLSLDFQAYKYTNLSSKTHLFYISLYTLTYSLKCLYTIYEQKKTRP